MASDVNLRRFGFHLWIGCRPWRWRPTGIVQGERRTIPLWSA